MKIKELRMLSDDALKAKLGEVKLSLSIERRKIASTGVSSKKVKVRELKRTVAQIMTLLRERGVKL
ncbi:MAG: 50S ribosomal protein L29 [Candidatus Micrarchaeia archaeon]|jgi:ribosomal protein L29